MVHQSKPEKTRPASQDSSDQTQGEGGSSVSSTTPKVGWWTDATKILTTQFLALILTPASVAITLYLTEHYKAPQPDLQYVGAQPGRLEIEPTAAFVTRINADSHLAWAYREEIRKASLTLQDPQACVAWLDGNSWDSTCVSVYKSVTNEVRGQIQTVVGQAKHGEQSDARIANFFLANQIPDAVRSLKVIDDFANELRLMESKERERSGGVQISVGILNRGASDGTVFRDAILKFQDRSFHVSTEKFVPVSAHSFAEVSFETPDLNAEGALQGTWRVGEEEVIKTWAELVRKGDELPFEITVYMSGTHDSIKGTVDKE
jgi:hypothetical protein